MQKLKILFLMHAVNVTEAQVLCILIWGSC